MLQKDEESSCSKHSHKHIDNQLLQRHIVAARICLEEIDAHGGMSGDGHERHDDQSEIGEGGLEWGHYQQEEEEDKLEGSEDYEEVERN